MMWRNLHLRGSASWCSEGDVCQCAWRGRSGRGPLKQTARASNGDGGGGRVTGITRRRQRRAHGVTRRTVAAQWRTVGDDAMAGSDWARASDGDEGSHQLESSRVRES